MPKIKLVPKEEENHRLAFTMVAVSFGVSLLWWVTWVFGTAMGFDVPEWSAAECTIFISPLTLLLYGEKWREGKNKQAALDSAEKHKAEALLAKNEQENITSNRD
jgi:hypothetical protein